ncbi:MAG: hypothetical protein ABI131_04275 [Nostocoides sp.]
MRTSPYAALPALACALLLAGCGATASTVESGTGSAAGSGTTSTSAPALPTRITTPPPLGDPVDPPLPSKRPPQVTGTGRVSVSDVEGGGCTVLTLGGQTYLLVGDGVSRLHDGDTVTVTGHADDTMMTTCQRGVVLVVTKLSTP